LPSPEAGFLVIVLLVLLVSWLAFRLLGGFGVPIFLTWHDCLPYALAVMFFFTSVAHFNRIRHDLAAMIPAFFPAPLAVVYLTGIFEITGAIGLTIPSVSALAAWCLFALVLGMTIANIHAARIGATLRGKSVTPLRLRLPMQLLFLALLYWSTRG
jgi:uncharacterized membrane protein